MGLAYLGAGIASVMTVARWIGTAPGATLALPAFAPWSIACLTLAVLSAVLWRTWTMKLTALPLLALGLLGAASGGRFDLAVAPTGDMAALRDADGHLTFSAREGTPSPPSNGCAPTPTSRRGRNARDAAIRWAASACCAMATLPRWCWMQSAFHEDCARAKVVISPLYAPRSCAPEILLDRARLAETGAVTLAFGPQRRRMADGARAGRGPALVARAPRRFGALPALAGDLRRRRAQNDEPRGG